MTVDQHNDDLEARLRSGLAQRAAATDITPDGLDRIQQRIRAVRVRRVGVAALAAVSLIGVSVGIYAGADSGRPVQTVDDGGAGGEGSSLPRLLPRHLPEGFELTGMRHFGGEGPEGLLDAMPLFEVYRPPGASTPLEEPVVVVMHAVHMTMTDAPSVEELAESVPGDTEVTQVRGEPALLIHMDAVAGVMVQHDDGSMTAVSARGLDADAVRALAADLELVDDDVVPRRFGSPPADLERTHAGRFASPGFPAPDWEGYRLDFAPEEGAFDTRFTVTVQRMEAENAVVMAGFGFPASRELPLRGTTAVAAGEPIPAIPPGADPTSAGDLATSAPRLVWAERPDVAISIEAAGIDLDDLVRVAESLEPVSAVEWEELPSRSSVREGFGFEPMTGTDAFIVDVVEGPFRAVLSAGYSGSALCFELMSDTGSGSGWCGSPPGDPTEGVGHLSTIEDRYVVVAAAHPDIELLVVEGDGWVHEQHATLAEVGGRTFAFFLVLLPAGTASGDTSVTYLDGSGRGLYTQTFAMDGRRSGASFEERGVEIVDEPEAAELRSEE